MTQDLTTEYDIVKGLERIFDEIENSEPFTVFTYFEKMSKNFDYLESELGLDKLELFNQLLCVFREKGVEVFLKYRDFNPEPPKSFLDAFKTKKTSINMACLEECIGRYIRLNDNFKCGFEVHLQYGFEQCFSKLVLGTELSKRLIFSGQGGRITIADPTKEEWLLIQEEMNFNLDDL